MKKDIILKYKDEKIIQCLKIYSQKLKVNFKRVAGLSLRKIGLKNFGKTFYVLKSYFSFEIYFEIWSLHKS